MVYKSKKMNGGNKSIFGGFSDDFQGIFGITVIVLLIIIIGLMIYFSGQCNTKDIIIKFLNDNQGKIFDAAITDPAKTNAGDLYKALKKVVEENVTQY